MQIVLLALFALVALFSGAHAFAVPRPMLSVSKTVAPRSVTSLNVFGGRGKKAAAAPVEENNDYWQGDWVCADCGYVFDRDIDGGGLYFEQQKKGFICPQCSAPRRRYAKKVGDKWGVTNDGGDFPIYFLTFAGLAAVTYFTLVVVPQL